MTTFAHTHEADLRSPCAGCNEMGMNLQERYPSSVDEYDTVWVYGKVHHVWAMKRPPYCDRGHWVANVQPAPGADVTTYTIDGADGWPRYYMDFDRMMAEVRDWLEWREKGIPE